MKFKVILAASLFMSFLLMPSYADAQVPFFKDICAHNGWESSVCEDASQGQNANPLYGPQGIISIVVNLLSLVVGVAAIIGIIVAGIRYLTSGSNPEEANKARELIIYAAIGLALAAIAQVLVRVLLQNIGV